ncbi:hypothetical protein [Tatumella sp. JGM118]|uniref:hypothetical protein n=1 Tax=Tatumella sp. JGM118 TaxID=2799796 RepID=UPI001BB0A3F8|nr:hypothetical protein [Tatumella sp. JGM118]MBS0910567.1 hypothetical protein [Tatumella sp. JGM118]
MKKLFDESQKIILGIFIGCILMIASFIVIESFIKNDFKNIASPLITVIIFLTTLSKFNTWLIQKNRDKAYERAGKLVDAVAKLELINHDIEIHLMSNHLFTDNSSKLVNEDTFKAYENELTRLINLFSHTHQEEKINYNMLHFWNVEIKKDELLPIDIQVELHDKLIEIASFAQKTLTMNIHQHSTKKRLISEFRKIKKTKEIKIKNFTDESFDGIFTIK